MNGSLQLHNDRSGFAVFGDISFANVMMLRPLGLQLLAECSQKIVRIDLVRVHKIDNVGLALLISWLRDAKKLGKSIRYEHVPQSLQQMAVVCGVDNLVTNHG